MMMNVTKISQKMKPLKKKYYRMRKMPYYNYKKLLFKKLRKLKYFTGYKDSVILRPLCIFCPQMIIYFLIKKEQSFH